MACEPDSNDNIANLSAILDTSNNVTDLLDVPNDLNYEPFKYIENNNYFMCDGIDPDSNIHKNICVDSLYYTESEFKEHFEFKQKGSCSFSLIHFNCRSMASNFDKLKDSVKGLDFPFDVIAISETWLKDNETNSSYSIDGYSSFQCSRLNKTGGGVALYISERLQPNYLPNKSKSIDNCAEIVTVEVALANGKKVLVSCVYRAPNTNVDVLSDFIIAILRNNRNKTIYVCGDFNIDLLQFDKNNYISDCIDNLYSMGLHPLITRPTRITCQSKTLVDNIFTSDVTSHIQSGLLINDTSDHLPIFQITDISINCPKNNSVYNKRRIVTDRNICEIISELEETEWGEILNSDDVNFSFETFVNKLTDIYSKNCPAATGKVNNKRPNKPWMTSGLKNACKKKNLLYKYFLKSRSKQSEDKYKTYKNKLTTILRKCEKNYNTKLLELNKGNLKETWRLLNSIINKKKKTMQVGNEFENKGESITGDENIANGFNNYFVNVGPSLANKIPATDTHFSQYLSDSTNVKNSLFLNPVTVVEILQIVANVKPKKSKGHDELGMCLIKKLIPYIVVPLKHIFNLSLLNGVFPDSMKIARVIPLFKTGNTKEFSNYRPISLLPQFSKILEKMYHSRLMAFIDSNQILYKSQYGFRKQMSTSLAIIELVEEITNSLDNHESTVGVFIDLKKAFDTVDHGILIEKLYHYGIRGIANKGICSYLMNRYQYVNINGTNSDYMNVLCGVPQGSILGPILFILYINDMCNVSTLLKPILFADDTNLFYSGKDIKEL